MFDGLHHAREHLSLEQTLALLRWLTHGYGTDAAHHQASSNSREIWIVFAVNPDGAEYDITGHALSGLAQEPPAEPRARRRSGRTSTATTAITGPAAAAHRARSRRDTYHGSAAFSTPEARAIRDFMASRRINGRQQIKTAITFHTAGEQILWPYGYTHTDVPADMTTEDHAALVAIGKPMAATNGYTPMQSSSLYVTDGDEIDWAYGIERIWMYTFELYPSHSQVSSDRPVLPARRAHRPRDRPQQGRDPVPHRPRRLPVRGHRADEAELRPAVRRLRDAATAGRSTRSAPTRRRGGAWAARQPVADRPPGRDDRPGARAMVTGRRPARA